MASQAIEQGLVEELRLAVPVMYSAASRACGLPGLEEAIRPWFATYPQPERTKQEWAAWWAGYLTVCGHLPTAAIHGAMAAWAKFPDSEYLPKPGKLAELARATPTPAFKLAGRAHQILQIADDMSGRARVAAGMERDQVKPEEQVAAVSGMLAEFKAKNIPVREYQRRVVERGTKFADAPELPPSGGKVVPGHGITAEMFRAMGWEVPLAPPAGEEPPTFSEDAP